MPLYILAGALIVVGAILFVEGLRRARLRRRIAQTPTTPIRHLVQNQFAEIVGRISCAGSLKTPDGDVPCVYYHYELERASRGSDTGPSWETMDRREQRTAFRLTDASGSIEVDPAGARIDAPAVVDRAVEAGEQLPFGAENVVQTPVGPAEELLHKGLTKLAEKLAAGGDAKLGNQRIRVTALPVDRDAYVLCTVQRRPDGSLRAVKGSNPFFISTKSERELLGGLGRGSRTLRILGPVLVALGIGVIAAARAWL
ncbi:MAG: hypothetical protein AMJ81_07315 [Phycisphaerae bacterium SM23_33]|jgi:hypothetical protein|nr:MAG: hypothetical protein AMJ81_07315 [Phycisphaerae bacterium SM23_33]